MRGVRELTRRGCCVLQRAYCMPRRTRVSTSGTSLQSPPSCDGADVEMQLRACVPETLTSVAQVARALPHALRDALLQQHAVQSQSQSSLRRDDDDEAALYHCLMAALQQRGGEYEVRMLGTVATVRRRRRGRRAASSWPQQQWQPPQQQRGDVAPSAAGEAHGSNTSDDDKSSSRAVVVTCSADDVAAYEHYRLARLLLVAGRDYVLDAVLQARAQALLPPHHTPLQVFCSAPHLFRVQRRRCSDSDDDKKEDAVTHTVCFVLHDRFAPTPLPRTPASRAHVRAQLRDVLRGGSNNSNSSSSSSSSGTQDEQAAMPRHGLVNRRKWRVLLRQLHYLESPSPYLDDRVLAQLLFDLLPLPAATAAAQHMGGGVTVRALLAALPPAAVSATRLLRRDVCQLLQRMPHLFTVRAEADRCNRSSSSSSSDGSNSGAYDDAAAAAQSGEAVMSARHGHRRCSNRHGYRSVDVDDLLVWRADVTPSQPPRTLASVDAEELLQALYTHYPHHRHPRCGTNIHRCLAKLPRLLQQRLYACYNVVHEVLLRYPDRVELLPRRVHVSHSSTTTTTTTRNSNSDNATTTQRDKDDDVVAAVGLCCVTPQQLRSCRNRHDFFVPFRFVGTLQARLLRRYRRRCRRLGLHPRTTLTLPSAYKH